MKTNKIIGVLLLLLAAATAGGMALANETYWAIYNYAMILFSVLGGIVLLKKK
jgi:Skp family chaperone for outer membrane proteins